MASRVVEDWNHNTSTNPHIFCLYGNLGSGKTTFAQGFARGLGLTIRVVSPTFLVSKRYTTPIEGHMFYHMDIYRMENELELQGIGIGDIFSDPDACVVVEWAEKLQSFLPPRRIDLSFSANDRSIHTIEIKQYD